MNKLILTFFVGVVAFSAYAQIRPSTIAKPVSPNALVSIKQRNLEIEQQAFFKRSNKDEVWFYENANYGGRKFVLERGSYSLKELGGDLNDFLSSAIIPGNLIVVVYTNDNFNGNWYILQPDNESNLNFETAVVAKAKIDGRLISGKVNINDVISSIVVYHPDKDYITAFRGNPPIEKSSYYTDLRNYTNDYSVGFRTFPAPYLNGTDGHNMADLGPLNDCIFKIELSNINLSVQIHQDADFKGYNCLLKKVKRNYGDLGSSDTQILPAISLTDCGTTSAIIAPDRDWKNRVSSLRVNIAPGRVTEITK